MIKVLYGHHFAANESMDNSVLDKWFGSSLETFIKFVKNNQGAFSSIEQIDKRGHAMVLTLDDGYKSIKTEVLPVLEKYDIPFFGHIGIGLLHPHFKELDDKVDDMYNLVKKLDGKISGEHGIGIKKLKYLDDKDLEYIQKFKDKYDPNDYFGVGVST